MREISSGNQRSRRKETGEGFTGGQEHTRLRSAVRRRRSDAPAATPWAGSRPPSGWAACSREYRCDQSSTSRASAVCGAPRSGYRPPATRRIRPCRSRHGWRSSRRQNASTSSVLALGGLHHQRAGHREAHRQAWKPKSTNRLYIVDGSAGDVVIVVRSGCTRGPPCRSRRCRAPGSTLVGQRATRQLADAIAQSARPARTDPTPSSGCRPR